jgi:predicted MPP superfamily phosphohydrolase
LIIPFENYAPFAPVKDRSFTHGLRAWKGRVIHISRGVGNAYGVRLNCRPEVTMLEIKGKG